MITFLLKFILSISTAIVLSLILGVLYFFIASGIVNLFGLNRGERNFGYHFFNAALLGTLLSFLMIFSFCMK